MREHLHYSAAYEHFRDGVVEIWAAGGTEAEAIQTVRDAWAVQELRVAQYKKLREDTGIVFPNQLSPSP